MHKTELTATTSLLYNRLILFPFLYNCENYSTIIATVKLIPKPT